MATIEPLQVTEANLDDVVRHLREAFLSGITRPYDFRTSQLKALKNMMQENKQALIEAVQKDLGKQLDFEVLSSEINIPLNEMEYTIKHLKSWMSPHSVSSPVSIQPASSEIYSEPKGVVLIMSPWNYPINLAVVPLMGAIAGGNTALVKLSVHSKNTSQLLCQLLQRYLDPRAYAFECEDGVPISAKMITYKWDHIFFTGSCSIGKLIYQAAAKHMTTVTLELGGKNPCIVDSDVDVDLAARRIVWGKFFNCGQTCIGIDHIFAHERVVDAFVEKLKFYIEQFYGQDPQTSKSYCRIISREHTERLSKLFMDGEVVYGGKVDLDDKYISPTIIKNPRPDSILMTDEIFGPILPIISVKDVHEAVNITRDKPLPLALYIFTKNSATAERVIAATRSGASIVNDVLVHFLNHNLPFGGVGESGTGAYHGRLTFDTFTHKRPVIKSTKYNALDVPLRYPPYTDNKTWIVEKVTRSGM